VRPDGSKEPTFGPNPAGLVIFESDGRYVSLVVRTDVPKFASNSRIAGTPEENKAAVHGGIATFGKYSIDEANKTLILQIERSSFPTGLELNRSGLLAKAAPPSPVRVVFPVHILAGGDPTAWLGIQDSNSEMSSQIIPLKGRTISEGLAEFRPQRLFAFQLRRWGYAARA